MTVKKLSKSERDLDMIIRSLQHRRRPLLKQLRAIDKTLVQLQQKRHYSDLLLSLLMEEETPREVKYIIKRVLKI